MDAFTLQLRVPSVIKQTASGEMLVFEFNFGPIHIACLANIPAEGTDKSVTYVKVELRPSKTEWEVWRGKD